MSRPPASQSRLPVRTGLALSAIALIASLALVEVVARIAGVDFNPNPNWRFHPSLGWTQDVAREFELDIEGRRVTVEFNAAGFRDVDHRQTKPAGTKRMVVIGDSFSEAMQVDLQDTWWKRTEVLLNDGEAGPWEAINLGVGDFGTAQALIALEEIGLGYDPDLVVLQMFPLNDVCNNSLGLARLCRSQNDEFRPYFVRRGGKLERTHASPVRHWLRTHLVSFGVVEKAILAATQPVLVSDAEHQRRVAEAGLPADPLLFTYAPDGHQIPGIAEGWRVTEEIVSAVKQRCDDAGIPLVVVVIPFEYRLGPRWEGLRRSFAAAPLVRDYPEHRLGATLDALGIPAVMMQPVLDGALDRALPYVQGHLGPAANALVARELHHTLQIHRTLQKYGALLRRADPDRNQSISPGA